VAAPMVKGPDDHCFKSTPPSTKSAPTNAASNDQGHAADQPTKNCSLRLEKPGVASRAGPGGGAWVFRWRPPSPAASASERARNSRKFLATLRAGQQAGCCRRQAAGLIPES